MESDKVVVLELWGSAGVLDSLSAVFDELEAGGKVQVAVFTFSRRGEGYETSSTDCASYQEVRAVVEAACRPFYVCLRVGVFAKVFNAMLQYSLDLAQECRRLEDLADSVYGPGYIMTYAERSNFLPDRLLQVMGLPVPEAHGAKLVALARARWPL